MDGYFETGLHFPRESAMFAFWSTKSAQFPTLSMALRRRLDISYTLCVFAVLFVSIASEVHAQQRSQDINVEANLLARTLNLKEIWP